MPDGALPTDVTEAPLVGARAADVAPEAMARVGAILGLARQAFIEKGFDGASMRDLARAAGMSASNFYRYFPGKAALVEALIARDLADVEQEFQAIATSPDPTAALKAVLRSRISEDCPKDHALWAEIVATAARKPEVAAVLDRMHEGIATRIADVLGLVAGCPRAVAQDRFAAPARLILLLVRGAAMEDCTGRPPAPGLSGLIMATIDRILDDAARGIGPKD